MISVLSSSFAARSDLSAVSADSRACVTCVTGPGDICEQFANNSRLFAKICSAAPGASLAS